MSWWAGKEAESGEPGKYTEEELAALEKTLKEHETWLNDVVEKQKKVAMYDDPAVESAELYSRAKVLENHLHRLVKKKAPKKKTKAAESSTTASRSAVSTAVAPRSSRCLRARGSGMFRARFMGFPS